METRSNRWYYPQMTLETPQTACVDMAPVPVNMAVCAIQHRPLHQNHAAFSLSGAAGTAKKYASQEMATSAQTAAGTLVGPKKVKIKACFKTVLKMFLKIASTWSRFQIFRFFFPPVFPPVRFVLPYAVECW